MYSLMLVCIVVVLFLQLLDELEELRLGTSQEKKQRVRLERQLREVEEEMVILKVELWSLHAFCICNCVCVCVFVEYMYMYLCLPCKMKLFWRVHVIITSNSSHLKNLRQSLMYTCTVYLCMVLHVVDFGMLCLYVLRDLLTMLTLCYHLLNVYRIHVHAPVLCVQAFIFVMKF